MKTPPTQRQIIDADAILTIPGPRPRAVAATRRAKAAPRSRVADAAWLACLASSTTTATVYVSSGLLALTAPVALAAILVPLLVAILGTALPGPLAARLYAAVAVLLIGFGFGSAQESSLTWSAFAFLLPAALLLAAARKLSRPIARLAAPAAEADSADGA